MKVFKKKEVISFEYEGTTFNLPGEMPIAATLYLYELRKKKEDTEEMTADDIRELYSTLLGKETAEKLIDNLQCGQETLEEIIQWYSETLAKKKTSPKG